MKYADLIMPKVAYLIKRNCDIIGLDYKEDCMNRYGISMYSLSQKQGCEYLAELWKIRKGRHVYVKTATRKISKARSRKN